MLGGLILMSKKCIIDEIKSIEVKNKDTDIIVIKIDTNNYDIGEANSIYTSLTTNELSDYNCVGIPSGVELEINSIDYLINYLEGLKK
jgi:hypothetical protein